MRGVRAELQNRALERAGEHERVDHRSLEKQRKAALEPGVRGECGGAGPRPGAEAAGTGRELHGTAEQASAAREGREYIQSRNAEPWSMPPPGPRGLPRHARAAGPRTERPTASPARKGGGAVSAVWRRSGRRPRRIAAPRGGGFPEPLARIAGRDEAERDGPETGGSAPTGGGHRSVCARRWTRRTSGTQVWRAARAVDPRAAGRGAEQATRAAGHRGRAGTRLEKEREVERARELDRGPTPGRRFAARLQCQPNPW